MHYIIFNYCKLFMPKPTQQSFISKLYRASRVLAATAMLLAAGSLAAFADLPAQQSDLPPLPKDLKLPHISGAQMTRPTLEMKGFPLVISNSPETLKDWSGNVALYRTTLSNNHFRVFFHHLNSTGRALKIGIAITNQDKDNPIQLFAGRNSQCLPGDTRKTVSTDPATAGRYALHNFFVSRTNPQAELPLLSMLPGKTSYMLQDVPTGSTIAGMYDFTVKAKENTTPNVVVTVIACTKSPDDPRKIPMLPPKKDGPNWHRRGTFAHSDRSGQLMCDASHIYWLDIAGPHEGPYCRSLGNEMEWATDDPQGFNPGNYGVIYHLKIGLMNVADKAMLVRALMSAAGGSGYSDITINGKQMDCKKMLKAFESWIFKEDRVESGSSSNFEMEFSLPGGSSGAHRLFFWPVAAK